MAYFLFIDESGQDQKESPCEVLAGFALRDTALWPFVKDVHKTEEAIFGRRYSGAGRELKGQKLLKKKVFKHANSDHVFSSQQERRESARKILENGAGAGPREFAALATAKLGFVRELTKLCVKYKGFVFACIVPKSAPRPENKDFLRKDYAYLFERFFYFLEDKATRGSGIIVFDELEKSRSHILIRQMDSYFLRTRKGNARAKLIVPEPFFVHSDLTTGIQVADLVAYSLAWGYYRDQGRLQPARSELKEFADAFRKLEFQTSRPDESQRRKIRGITVIRDLRARQERG